MSFNDDILTYLIWQLYLSENVRVQRLKTYWYRVLVIGVVFWPWLGAAQQQIPEPEAAFGLQQKTIQSAKEYMVVAANPYAAWAGKNIIEKGGSAVDAAIAVQAMLTLVEPQSSGIGGGAFMLYWDNQKKQLYSIDGRETAPASVNPAWFMNNTEPMKWIDAVVGGRSVGVPGVLRGLELAHSKAGTLPWSVLFEDSIQVAEEGFKVSARLASLVATERHPGLKTFTTSSVYFYPAGFPLKEGTLKKNPSLAKTLRGIAQYGADYFYKGELADNIVAAVNEAKIAPGNLSKDDLAQYQAVLRPAVCGQYRQHKICGMAPPSSGGIGVYQLLKMLESQPLSDIALDSAEFVHLFAQASARVYADRDMFIADTSFVKLPFAALMSPAYLQQRAADIGLTSPWKRVRAGEPYGEIALVPGKSPELPNTSHFSIIDKQGNAVSMTTSIEFMFGSGLMVGGFLLNNQLTDFSFAPMRGDQAVANRVEPGKRPRSAMSPTMVFDHQGALALVVGSPGGSRIMNYVAQTLIAVLDHQLDIQEAINLPRVTNRNDVTALEAGTFLEPLKPRLEKLGHKVVITDLNSGLHGIQIKQGLLLGGADPRREGVAVGK